MIDPPWIKPVSILRLGVKQAEPVPVLDDARFAFDAEVFRLLSQHSFRRLVWSGDLNARVVE
jgi:hypothetical protein